MNCFNKERPLCYQSEIKYTDLNRKGHETNLRSFMQSCTLYRLEICTTLSWEILSIRLKPVNLYLPINVAASGQTSGSLAVDGKVVGVILILRLPLEGGWMGGWCCGVGVLRGASVQGSFVSCLSSLSPLRQHMVSESVTNLHLYQPAACRSLCWLTPSSLFINRPDQWELW